MNIAVIGSGGREHALCFKLKESKLVNQIICVPGNAGTNKIAKNIDAKISDFENLYKIFIENKVDLIVVGPEQPLVDGIVDFFDEKKIKIFGPNKIASQLEGSKSFMKNMCKENNIPTANFGIFKNIDEVKKFIKQNKTPIVVKADGLASGKGVAVCQTKDEAVKFSEEIFKGKFKSSSKVVLEEFLEGEEMSYFVIADSKTHKFFGSAQDHKRVGENDVGPNTGGMGAYSPSAIINEELKNKIENKIIIPTLEGMKKNGNAFKGFLYAGLMINKSEPFLIEYNIRMGDPECQPIMTRLESDLCEIIKSATENNLDKINIKWKSKKSMCIVLCANGYPGKYEKDLEIENINKLEKNKDDYIFHAGTYEKNKKIYSSGGRVLNICSMSEKLVDARNSIINLLKKLDWKHGFYRKDIGWRAIKK